MFTNLKRILMAEVDAGGGAIAPVPAASSQESVPQAQGAPVITKDVADLIAQSVAKAVAEQRDSIFAEARRTFTEKKSAKQPLPVASDPAAPPEALSIDDKFSMVRELDRALLSSGLGSKLNASQMKRAEKALLAERPDDVATWVKDYFDGYAVAPQPAPAQASQPVAAAPLRPAHDLPVSDRGAPPASRVALVDQNIFSLSDADRAALLKEKGAVWYRDKVFADGKGQKVTVR